MKLHLQTSVHAWVVVEIPPRSWTRNNSFLDQIEGILKREQESPSKQRASTGFHVTLSREEERKLVKYLEPLHGALIPEGLYWVVYYMVENADLGIKVYPYVRARDSKEKFPPSFVIAMS